MIKKPCVELFLNLKSKILKQELEFLAKEKFVFVDTILDADLIVTDTLLNLENIQIVIDSSTTFKESSPQIIYFQPFLYEKGNIEECSKTLFQFCIRQTEINKMPTKNDNTILILD